MRPYALAVAALLLAVPASAGTGALPAPTPPPYREHPLPAGPTVAASGQVLARPGGPVLFCPPRAVELSAASAVPPCAGGIPTVNVDTSRLANRQRQGGTVWGRAWLRGVLSDGMLYVTAQGPPRDPDLADPLIDSRRVPCPAPAGGWPHGPAPSRAALDRYMAAHPGEVVHVRDVRPDRETHVLFVTLHHDPAPFVAALRPAYGNRLCAVKARYTTAQVEAIRAAIRAFMREGHGVSAGGGFTATPDDRPRIGMDVDVMTPEIRRFLASQPQGFIKVTVWLAEVPSP